MGHNKDSYSLDFSHFLKCDISSSEDSDSELQIINIDLHAKPFKEIQKSDPVFNQLEQNSIKNENNFHFFDEKGYITVYFQKTNPYKLENHKKSELKPLKMSYKSQEFFVKTKFDTSMNLDTNSQSKISYSSYINHDNYESFRKESSKN